MARKNELVHDHADEYSIELYLEDHLWHWRVIRNTVFIAHSHYGYPDKGRCKRSIHPSYLALTNGIVKNAGGSI